MLGRKGRRGGTEREQGAVAVEFAIILPLLSLILFGIIQFGIAFSQYEVYVGAAREGGRYAAVRCVPDSTTGCTSTLIENKVKAAAAGYTITGSPTENIACSGSTIGQPVTVSWSQNMSINIPFWKSVAFTKTISGVFRCE